MNYIQDCTLVTWGLGVFLWGHCDMAETTNSTKLLLCSLSLSYLSDIVELCSWSYPWHQLLYCQLPRNVIKTQGTAPSPFILFHI